MKNPLALLQRRRLFRREHALLTAASVDERARMSDLAASIERAARLSPFYREHFRAHDTAAITSLDALRALPLTTKADLLDGPDRAVQADSATTWGTSGSSGQPFVFGVDRNYAVRHESSRAAVFTRAGLANGATVVEILPGTRTSDRPDLAQPLHRRYVVGYARPDFVDLVVAREPALVYGNRSHLLEICQQVETTGRPFAVDHIVSSSEMLLDADRIRLETTLGASIHDLYGLAEASNIAYRLAGDPSWQPLAGRVIVEVVDDAGAPVGPGERGEIVVTTLREPTSPMIRYRTGDLAVVSGDASGPADGRSDVRFDQIEGRRMDALVNAEGTASVSSWGISTSRFWANGDVGRLVRQWQVAQAEDRSVDVRLVLNEPGRIDTVAEPVRRHLQEAMGAVEVRIHEQAEVHDPTTGKFRAITSKARPTAP